MPHLLRRALAVLFLGGVLFALGLAAVGGPPLRALAATRLPTAAGWPLTGSPSVSRAFDPPADRYGAGHRGVDLPAQPDDPVLAAAAGVVTFAGRVAGRGVLTVDHGNVRTSYEPVEARVRAGEVVRLGQLIGVVGSGGHCSARCLHWSLRDGTDYLDPLLLIRGTAVSSLRLVAADRRAIVAREAAARAAAARMAAAGIGPPGDIGKPGSHGFLLPVPGRVTSGFGMRFHPVLHVWKLHDGTDLGASCGTPIRAAYDGRVSRRYYKAGYGNRLIIEHGRVDGVSVRTAYNHATRFVVRPGQRVRRGQLIGYVGQTGYATGCHLHLMVWLNGRMVNPMTWF